MCQCLKKDNFGVLSNKAETSVSAAVTVNVMGEVAVIIPTISPNEGRQKVFKHIYVDLGQGELRDADDEKLKIHKIWFFQNILEIPDIGNENT